VFFIVALVLLFLLPSPWNFVGFLAGLTVFVGEVLFWNRKVRGQRKAVGAETLTGKAATVVSPCRPSGQVRIAGEIWAARCSAGADAGETVTVVGRDGLTLLVEPARADTDLPALAR
jgi:membrane protein implicated in regulation of membrane protease activity